MRTVEFFKFRVTERGRQHDTRYLLTAEDAAARYPEGAVPIANTRVVRQVPETEAEIQRAQTNYQSAGHDSVQPPRKR
jgi:hypothetical protein